MLSVLRTLLPKPNKRRTPLLNALCIICKRLCQNMCKPSRLLYGSLARECRKSYSNYLTNVKNLHKRNNVGSLIFDSHIICFSVIRCLFLLQSLFLLLVVCSRRLPTLTICKRSKLPCVHCPIVPR